MKRVIGMRLTRSRKLTHLALGFSLAVGACSSIGGVNDNDRRVSNTNVQLAIGYLKKGDIEIAREKVDRALQFDSKNPDAHTAAAFVYDALFKPDIADKHYQLAIEYAPENGANYNNYGTFLCKQKRWKESVDYFVKAANTPRYPTPAYALENAGACATLIPDVDLAENYLRLALKANPKLPTALFEMAKISFSKNKDLSVRAYLQRYEEVAQHTAQSLWLGIQSERRLGNTKAADRYAKLLQTQFPDSTEFKRLLNDSEQQRAGS